MSNLHVHWAQPVRMATTVHVNWAQLVHVAITVTCSRNLWLGDSS